MSIVHDATDVSDLVDAVRHRRLPSQARSRERVQRLLDTADELIGTDGLSALTVPVLAARARVPVGTIYQFFPDKSALVDAIAERYMQESLEVMSELVDKIAELRWDAALDAVIEQFTSAYRAHPTFREIWFNGHLSSSARERDRRNNDDLANLLYEALNRRPEFRHARRLKLAARTVVEMADGLLRYAFTLSPDGDSSVITELKRAVSSYLREYATTPSPAVRATSPSRAR